MTPLRVYVPLATRLAYGTSIAPFQPTLACTAVALRWWSSNTSRRSPRGVRRRSASVLPPRAGTISTFSPDCVFRRTFSFTISSAEPKLSSSTTNLAMEADVAETVKMVSIVTSMRRDEAMLCEAAQKLSSSKREVSVLTPSLCERTRDEPAWPRPTAPCWPTVGPER